MKSRTIIVLAVIAFAATSAVFGQKSEEQSANIEKVRTWRKAHERKILDEFFELLTIPNWAHDTSNIKKNADFIAEMLQKRGIEARLLTPAKVQDTPPAVYGEVVVPGAKRTIVFYAHYDGQPVNPGEWHPVLKPYRPVFLSAPIDKGGEIIPEPVPDKPIDPGWRISGRSSADDKAGVMLIINAYDSLIENGIQPTSNIKFFFEGEEEIGSVNLGGIMANNRALLRSDLWIVADGPVLQNGMRMVGFGVRGDVNVDITVYGPKRPLHSGHYGNWAPNPALLLAKLLASMKDDNGFVTIEGYYADVVPLTDLEKKAIAEIPSIDEQMKKELGIKNPDGGGKSLFELYGYPSLNINGIRSADVGDNARNVISTEATATLDLRQVLGTDYKKQVQRVIDHIKAQGFHVSDKEPTEEERQTYDKIAKVTVAKGGYNAQRTPLDLPISQAVIAALKSAANGPVVVEPTSGGSLPLYLIEKHLNAKVINLCIVNHDSNQHGENENVRIQNLWESLELLAALMIME